MSLKETLLIQRNYFKEYSCEIALRNLNLMTTVCYAGIVLYIAYYLVTVLFFPEQSISLAYGIIVPVFALYLVYIRQLKRQEIVEFKSTQTLTIVMHLTVMIYAIVMSVVPHPEMQAVYYPLFLLLGPVMFILPLYQQFLINGCSYVFFYIMVIQLKPESCWMHDLFEGFTALVFSVILILLMTQFRVQSDGLKEKYYRLSRQDGLTGLLNKVTGMNLIRDYVENTVLKEPFSLIILDIDEFKHINDTYGHEQGDILLEKIGHMLEAIFRKQDIVSRYGGDEFLMLLKNISKENTNQKMEELKRTLDDLTVADDMHVTCSMGIYTGVCGKDKFTEIMSHADEALYQVKNQGKNDYRYYE